MAVYKRGNTWWYKFRNAGRPIQESAKTKSKTLAKEAEKARRRELEEGFNAIDQSRKDRVRSLADLAAEYLKDYRAKKRAATFAEYAVGHVVRHLGAKMAIEIGDKAVKGYQTARLEEN